MGSIPDFDQQLFYLGPLCKRGHDWNGTGGSLRYRSTSSCRECHDQKLAEGHARGDWASDNAEYQRQRRDQRLEQGLCVRCGRAPHLPGLLTCERCRASASARGKVPEIRAAAQENQRQLRAAREAIGLCVRCGRNRADEGIKYCRACMDVQGEQSQARRAADPDYFREQDRQRRLKLRRQVIERYGGKCRCCGESEFWFLVIDHIDGGGNQERRETGKDGGSSFYAWLRQQGFPDGYTVLCWNCNAAIGMLGYCPHERLSDADYF